jgi:hypothetical protein
VTPNLTTPSPYVAGTVTVPANTVVSLLTLIQQQLDRNCPGGPRELSITASAGGGIYIGTRSPVAGALAAGNFGLSLAPGQTKSYTSSYPGAQAPLGNLQVLSTGSPATIHIEVIS